MQFSVGNLLKDRRETTRYPGGAGAAKGGVFRKAKFVHAIRVEAGTRPETMDTASLDFREVRQQLGEQLVGATDQVTRVGEQLAVSNMVETVGLFYTDGGGSHE